MTRQAVTKHLRVMQKSGLVRCTRRGRESIWQLDQVRMDEVRSYLDQISEQWDDALKRLRSFIEES
jgi:predicted transcriptional regulator